MEENKDLGIFDLQFYRQRFGSIESEQSITTYGMGFMGGTALALGGCAVAPQAQVEIVPESKESAVAEPKTNYQDCTNNKVDHYISEVDTEGETGFLSKLLAINNGSIKGDYIGNSGEIEGKYFVSYASEKDSFGNDILSGTKLIVSVSPVKNGVGFVLVKWDRDGSLKYVYMGKEESSGRLYEWTKKGQDKDVKAENITERIAQLVAESEVADAQASLDACKPSGSIADFLGIESGASTKMLKLDK